MLCTDVIIEIAKFMDYADELVLSSKELRNEPLSKLCHIGVTTKAMLFDHDCVLVRPSLLEEAGISIITSHPCPEMIANYILAKDDDSPNYKVIVRGLAQNKHWHDDIRSMAVTFLEYAINNDGFDIDDAVETVGDSGMRDICRYDMVLKYYSEYTWGPIDNIDTLRHGRSLYRMYTLVAKGVDNEAEIVKLHSCQEELEEFFDNIVEHHGIDPVKRILACVDVPSKYRG